MDKSFRKDLRHVSWDRVYERQALRQELVGDWLEGLRLKPGARVLEIGAGPGYVSLILAGRVGPSGLVYAVDRSADALADLARRQEERGIAWIRRIAADAATLDPAGLAADCALVTMVLHHTDDPEGILRNVARFLPPGAPVVIGEFDPEGPCAVGPPRESRLAPDTIRAWCVRAGLAVVAEKRQTPEHYMLVAERGRDIGAASKR